MLFQRKWAAVGRTGSTSDSGSDGDEGGLAAEGDRCYAAFLIMYLQGLGSLLAWNAFITPTDFYALLFRDSVLEHSFMIALTSTFTLVGVLTLLGLQRLQHSFSVRSRILGSLLLVMFAFVLATAVTMRPLLLTDLSQTSLAESALVNGGLLLLSAIIASSGQAVLVGSVTSYATIYEGALYMQAVTGGQALAGLAVSLGNVLRTLPELRHSCALEEAGHQRLLVESSGPMAESPGTSSSEYAVIAAAARYFGVASIVLVLCFVSFLVLERLPFTKRCKLRVLYRKQAEEAATDAAAAHGAEGGGVGWWAAVIVLTFGTTLALFPALTSTIRASPSGSSCVWRGLFVPMMFVLFNIGDLLGRNMSCCLPRHRATACALALSRLGFAPIFLLALDSSARPDAMPLITMLAFATSNGWLCLLPALNPHASLPRSPSFQPQASPPRSPLLSACLSRLAPQSPFFSTKYVRTRS